MDHQWIAVANVVDIPEETGLLRVQYKGAAVCLYRLGDKACATQDQCPHGNASLSEGYIVDDMIECPLHQGMFDIASGEVRGPPCTENLATYPARIENGVIYLREDVA
jgi:anthranilate 1,2-dioxygenase ferredoxin subunit